MIFQMVPYTAPMILAAGVCAAIAFYAWRKRGRELPAFIALMLAVAIWCLGYAVELGGMDLGVKNLGAKIKYVGVTSLPVSWLLFAIKFVGWEQKWITPRNVILLYLEPVLVYLLVWTNDFHGLIWRHIYLESSGPLLLRVTTHGYWFWIHTAYSYLLLLLGTLLFIRTFLRSKGIYRGQARAIMIGAVFPWIGNLLHITGLKPVPYIDPTPFAFTITGLSMGWGLFSVRLLDILPVARDSIIENMQEGVVVLDTRNRVIDMNPLAKSIIGMNDSDVIGQSAEKMLSSFAPDITHYIDAREAKLEIVSENGPNRHFFDLNLTPLFDGKNNFTGKIIVLRDTTESRRARAELEAAKEKAEIASCSKSEFLANMSHELRTPLNHIMGFTELVMEEHFGSLNEIQKEYLQDVIQSSNHLLSLINDILDLSKIEAGKLELVASDVRPVDLLENSLVILKEKALKHGLTITTDFGELPKTIAADERKLKQILYNLLSNAVKFTPDGGTIRLRARQHPSCGGRFRAADGREILAPANNGQILKGAGSIIEISVSDSGIGLKKNDLERIFTPFDQLENAMQKKQPGTGLGLSLTRKLVELHGGLIWAESDGKNKGSTFRFIIPVSRSPMGPTPAAEKINTGRG